MNITPKDFFDLSQIIEDEDITAFLIKQFDAIRNAKTLRIIPSMILNRTTSYLYDVEKNMIIGEFDHKELTKIVNSRCKPENENNSVSVDLTVKETLRRGRRPNVDYNGVVKKDNEDIVEPIDITYDTRLCQVKSYLIKRAYNLLCNNFVTMEQTTLRQISKLHPSNLAELKGFGNGVLNNIAELFTLGSLSFSKTKKTKTETINILSCKD